MKKLLFLSLLFINYFNFAQENSAIYVCDFSMAYEGLELLNVQKISTNDGYNNQPSFASNEALLYAGNNNGQTDIAEYDLISKTSKWKNKITQGSEYSPQKFPSNNDLAAVRLDKDGLQRLYKYNSEMGNSSDLIENIQVAYFAFYNDKTILSTVLNGEKMDLALIDLQKNTTDTLFRNAGRSLQKIPKTQSMSYSLINDAGNLDMYMLDMNSFESFFITELPIGIQDYVWINDTQVIVASGNKLYLYDTLGEPDWVQVASLEEYGLKDITRLAISPDTKKLALVANK
ncbi:hypothetical protein [Aequorivita echinoideorum]|uniref:WD40-like Beta Propeller Repeat n=1 Tax=Aequorivita echinoideorum TaxID=1549647 RepID=A0ABS5S955_9FLAO|nr:hypothetical protein [Aequorivita echinoideorum]MBT0608877.1 hypothetical protein [Aequorivita echinoideorum]